MRKGAVHKNGYSAFHNWGVITSVQEPLYFSSRCKSYCPLFLIFSHMVLFFVCDKTTNNSEHYPSLKVLVNFEVTGSKVKVTVTLYVKMFSWCSLKNDGITFLTLSNEFSHNE